MCGHLLSALFLASVFFSPGLAQVQVQPSVAEVEAEADLAAHLEAVIRPAVRHPEGVQVTVRFGCNHVAAEILVHRDDRAIVAGADFRFALDTVFSEARLRVWEKLVGEKECRSSEGQTLSLQIME